MQISTLFLSLSLASFLSLSLASSALAQTPAFEVASVKVHPPSTDGRTFRRTGSDPGMITYENINLKPVIARACGVLERQVDGPEWLNKDGFDITAKVPEGTPKDQIPPMLLNLLVERFKLATHKETRTVPLFALVVAKGGPKLKPSEPAPAPAGGSTGGSSSSSNTVSFSMSGGGSGGGSGSGSTISMGMIGGGGGGGAAPVSRGSNQMRGRYTMASLAERLSNPVAQAWGGAVIDATELTGSYDIELTYTMADDADSSVPSLTEALAKLGLKLEPRKGPVDFVVVDHAERVPIEN